MAGPEPPQKPVVIFGAGQFAEVVHFYLTQDAGRRVTAFTVDASFLDASTFLGLPAVAFEEVESHFPPSEFSMFIALGPHHVNRVRAEKFMEARRKGYELVSYISSKASVWPDLVHGANTLVTDGSVVLPFVRMGDNVALWGARIGHHCTIGDHCTLSDASLAGGVHVGDRTFIGTNASVKEHVRVGQRNVIGAGAVILLSTADDAVHAVHHTRASRVPSHRLG